MKTANPSKEVNRYLDSSNGNTSKEYKVFQAFINGWRGHRFNAERQLHDHCLHSTVSTIEKKYRIIILRKWVSVAGYQGTPTRVKSYWMSDEDKKRFVLLLASNGDDCGAE